MANIKLKQLNFVTHELTENESSEVMGGDFWFRVKAITSLATGIAGIGNGLLTAKAGMDALKQPLAPNNSGPSVGTDIWTKMALQEAFGSDW